jgi:tRNA G18 (ribose-2'-O)-methylase SpoU
LGAEDTVAWSYLANTVEAVRELHQEGYHILSIEQAEGATLLDRFTPQPNKKYAFIFGNEVRGVQQEVVDISDGCIEIPQFGTKHSLNVSVSIGVVLWDFFIKRKRS